MPPNQKGARGKVTGGHASGQGTRSQSKGARRDGPRKDTPHKRRDRSASKFHSSAKRRRPGAGGGGGGSASSGSGSSGCGSPLPKLPQLVLTPALSLDEGKNGDSDKQTPRVAMVPRAAKKIEAALITVTKNNQGEDHSTAYCLAALAGNPDGSARLIRLVPDIGHFWSDEALPAEMREMHAKHPAALFEEPQWPFSPIVVGFEAGTLPDAVTGPHRMDDVVARKLEFVSTVEDMDSLYEQLSRIACDSLDEIWPEWAWASSKGLIPNSNVPSLAIFHGEVKWVMWRTGASPLVDIVIDGKEVSKIPFAAHRLHDDKGYAMLTWMQEQGSCLLLLGLSRTFHKNPHSAPQCPILLLRVFPTC